MSGYNFNEKHILWWVLEWMDAHTLTDTTAGTYSFLDMPKQAEFDYFIDQLDVSEKEKEVYKSWVWQTFVEKRKIYKDVTSKKEKE